MADEQKPGQEAPETKEAVDIKGALANLKSQFDAEIKKRADAIQAKADEKVKEAEDKIKAIQDEAAEMQKQLDEISLRQKDKKDERKKSLQEQIEENLSKNADKFKEVVDNRVNFRMKAAEIIDTGNFGAGVIQGMREPGINAAPRRVQNVLSLIQTMNGGAGTNPLTWIEWKPKDGGPDTVAESGTKPLMDWTYTEGTSNAQVIAVVAYTTMQALLNMPQLAQEINNELLGDLADELAYQVLLGSGTAPDLKGIDQYAKAFTGSSLAGEIEDANIFDVLRAAILQVRKGNKATTGYTRRTGYVPNAILVSPDRAAQMDLKKDNNGNYILPPFTSQDNTQVKGIPVLVDDFIDADDFYVGDFSKGLLNYVRGLTIETGWINDQFIKNQLTIRAEVYANFRIKYHDAWAFVKGDFTSAKALLQATT